MKFFVVIPRLKVFWNRSLNYEVSSWNAWALAGFAHMKLCALIMCVGQYSANTFQALSSFTGQNLIWNLAVFLTQPCSSPSSLLSCIFQPSFSSCFFFGVDWNRWELFENGVGTLLWYWVWSSRDWELWRGGSGDDVGRTHGHLRCAIFLTTHECWLI